MKKKSLKKLFIAIPVALLLLVVGATLSLFSLHPKYPIPELNQEDWANQSKIMLKTFPKIYKSKPDDVAKITLSAQEISSLLKFALNGERLVNQFSSKTPSATPKNFNNYTVSYQDGHFIIEYAHLLSDDIAINLTTHATIEVTDSYNFTFQDSYAGYYPLSNRFLEKLAFDYIKDISSNTNHPAHIYLKAVKSIERKSDNALKITYYPYILRQQLKKNLSF